MASSGTSSLPKQHGLVVHLLCRGWLCLSGSVFKGRGAEWKRLYRGDMTLPFRDMVWHQGKVWCTSDYGLWVVDSDKVKEADVPDKIRAYSGHLSVGDGVMLLAGIYGAAMHDGREWRMVIDFNNLE